MPVGDDATAYGFPLVSAGDEVALGYNEINRTRDFVAQVGNLILATWPITKGGTGATTVTGAQENLGFYTGTGEASDSAAAPVDGTIYFKIIS